MLADAREHPPDAADFLVPRVEPLQASTVLRAMVLADWSIELALLECYA